MVLSSQQHRQPVSIAMGNGIQAVGLCAGMALLVAQARPGFVVAHAFGFLVAYLMVALTSYAPAQYVVGRLLGIRFSHYSVGTSPQYPTTSVLLRFLSQVVVHMSIHAEPKSWIETGRAARAIFVISGALVSTLISVGIAGLAMSVGLWIGPVFVAINVLWLAYVMMRHWHATRRVRAVGVLASR